MRRSQAAAALPPAQVDPAKAFPDAVADGPDDFTARFRKATKKRAGPFEGRPPSVDCGAGSRIESSSSGAAGASAAVSHRSIDLQVRLYLKKHVSARKPAAFPVVTCFCRAALPAIGSANKEYWLQIIDASC